MTSGSSFWQIILLSAAIVLILFEVIRGWRLGLMRQLTRAVAIVAAYAISCAATFVFAIIWFHGAWRSMPDPEDHLPHSQLWSKLVPFAQS